MVVTGLKTYLLRISISQFFEHACALTRWFPLNNPLPRQGRPAPLCGTERRTPKLRLGLSKMRVKSSLIYLGNHGGSLLFPRR